MYINRVELLGYLGQDPEMRFSPKGLARTTFRVATTRRWKDGSGNLQEETEWSSIVCWDKQAERCNQHLRKGSRVFVTGRLQTSNWQDNDGKPHYRTEIVASDVIFLDVRPTTEQEGVGVEEETEAV